MLIGLTDRVITAHISNNEDAIIFMECLVPGLNANMLAYGSTYGGHQDWKEDWAMRKALQIWPHLSKISHNYRLRGAH